VCAPAGLLTSKDDAAPQREAAFDFGWKPALRKLFIAGRDSRSLQPPGSERGLCSVRSFWPIFAICAVLAPWLGTGTIRADTGCTGDACGVLAVSGEGCAWTNKGAKAVRFSLIVRDTSRVVTVLAPGETFKEADKAFCVVPGGAQRYQASFAVLSSVSETVPKPAAPLAKPSVAPASGGQSDVAGLTVPLPRVKPAAPAIYPPRPRVKPALPAIAEAPAASAAPASAVAPAPTVGAVDCAEGGCPPILFKVVDGCLWVLNLNPRPVAFEAVSRGQSMKLSLEAADGAKADSQASTGGAARDLASMHMRLKDPFQSAGSGIPVYRARLGGDGACLKDRSEITQFSARYMQ
jgi:hypothetical protein